MCFLCPLIGLAIWLLLLWARHRPDVAVVVAPPGQATLQTAFQETVHPFLKTYCTTCHAGAKPKGDLDLTSFESADAVAKDLGHWETVLQQLDTNKMPPRKAELQPPAELRQRSSPGSANFVNTKPSAMRATPARSCRAG